MARDKRVDAAVPTVRHPGNFVADVGAPRTTRRPAVHRLQPVPPPLGAARAARGPRRAARADGAVRRWRRAGSRRRPSRRRPTRSRPARPRRASACAAGSPTGSSATRTRHDRLAGGTSELSPYLHFGCVSARETEERARGEGRPRAPTRSSASSRGATSTRTSCCTTRATRGTRTSRSSTSCSWADDDEALDAWREGRTGFPVVDAGMRQLLARGWMHNRARLIVASFLTKDLHIDWREGERHFMRHLLCGDEAQNNGNWQWITSIGVDPAPYFRRMYNPMTQQMRHDPDGEYVRRWCPELARRPARAPRRAVGDERGRAGGRGLRDRPRLPGADRRPQGRARARDGALPRGVELTAGRGVASATVRRRPWRPSSTSSATSPTASRRSTSRASARCPTCRRRTTGTGATSSSTSGSRRARTGRRVVDLACGEGYGSAVLARTAASVVGVDANPEAFEHARLKYTRPGLRFERDMIETWTGDVDCVVFLQTIEHVQDPDAVLERLRGLIGPGGVAYVSTPNVLTLAPAGQERSGNPWHVREYRPERVPRAVRAPLRAGRPARALPRAQAARCTSSRSSTRAGTPSTRGSASRSASTTASRPRSPCATSRCAAGALDRALDLLAVLRP